MNQPLWIDPWQHHLHDMTRFILIISIVITLGLVIIFSIFSKDEGPAFVPVEIRLAPRDELQTSFDLIDQSSLRIAQGVEDRFQDAPRGIIDIAIKIADRSIPFGTYIEDLRALSPAEINAGYGSPHPGFDYKHNLLREAVVSQNAAAFAQLVDQGADLSYNDNELPFQAVKITTPTGAREVWFPDYREGNRMLQFWLDAGGDPNITHPAYARGWGTILMQTPINNLEGLDLLLGRGGDPWAETQVKAQDGITLYALPGFFETLVRADPIGLEVSYRLALNGYYANGSESDKARLRGSYRKLMADVPRDRSESSDAMIWLLKQSASQVFNNDTAFLQDAQMQSFMRIQTAFGVGGFFLRQGETRSPDSFDQYVESVVQFGRNRWTR